MISGDIKNGDYYTAAWSYDFLYKKYFGLFKRQIGAYSLRIIHHDSLIFSANRIYRYTNNNETNEFFYFTDNRLIKYEKKMLDGCDSSMNNNLHHSIVAYFDNNRIIKQINDNYSFDTLEQQKICKIPMTEIPIWIKLINEAEDLSQKK